MVTLFAIKHKRTDRFVTGTNFRYSPPRQILSDCECPLILTGYNLLTEITRRHINLSEYIVVKVTVKEV